MERGSFPIVQALEITRLVNEETATGNDIYAIGLPEDDGVGMGKHASYVSQRIDNVI